MVNHCDAIIDDVVNKVAFMAGEDISFDFETFDPQGYTALYHYMNYYDYESWDFGKEDEHGAGLYSIDKAVKSVAYVLKEHYEGILSEYFNDVEGFALSDDALGGLMKHATLLHFISRKALSEEVKAWVDEQLNLAGEVFAATKK